MNKVIYWVTMVGTSATVGAFSPSWIVAIIGGAVVALVWIACFDFLLKE